MHQFDASSAQRTMLQQRSETWKKIFRMKNAASSEFIENYTFKRLE